MIVYSSTGFYTADSLSGWVIDQHAFGRPKHPTIRKFNVAEWCRYHKQEEPDQKIEIQDIGYWPKQDLKDYVEPDQAHRAVVRRFVKDMARRARRLPYGDKQSEIHVVPHRVFPDQRVVEIWWNGEFLATVMGADGPGVRLVSKRINKESDIKMIVAGGHAQLLITCPKQPKPRRRRG